MCGFAGIVDPTGADVDRDVVRRMTAALAARGPDGEGFHFAPGVGLGHRRLAVIDLSEASAQPIAGSDDAVQVVFNGEIYDFADLRAELQGAGHRFRSRGDAEVLARGWEHWGEGLLDRLHGMFAFAAWDGRTRRLLLARDRMGKKPLYWAQVPRSGLPPLLAFASELKGLLAVPGLDRTVDLPALAQYLVFEHVPAPATILAGARKLDAGERLLLDVAAGGPPEVRRWWDVPFPERHAPWGEADAAAAVWDLLRRAVERRLVADVPLGAFLSGGLDSSAVVAAMADLVGGAQVRTFSIAFDDPSHDESAHARAVAAHLGTDHHEARLDAGAIAAAVPEVGRFLDEPLGDASIVPTYLLCRSARVEVKVALSGDGGDELFAGYPTFVAERAARVWERLPEGLRAAAARAAARLPAGAGYMSGGFKLRQFLRGAAATGPRRHQRWLASFLPEELPALLSPEARRGAGGDPLEPVDRRAALGPARDEADRLMDFYLRFYLAGDVNTKVDRAAGAVGMEVRCPLQDADLLALACRLPPALRLRRMTPKYVLRRALQGRLPPAVIAREKQGFAVPMAALLRGPLAPLLRDELAPARLGREGLFAPQAVTRLVDEHLGGRRDHRKALWTLLVFQRWRATFGAG